MRAGDELLHLPPSCPAIALVIDERVLSHASRLRAIGQADEAVFVVDGRSPEIQRIIGERHFLAVQTQQSHVIARSAGSGTSGG